VGERAENDFYPTPNDLAVAICKRLSKVLPNGHFDVIEPSAGAGAFVRPLRELWGLQPLIAIDINPNVQALRDAGADDVFKADWVSWAQTYKVDGPTLVVGNPPFSLAQEHISAGLDYLLPGSHICFLLKMNFFGGKERELTFWRQGQLRYFIPILGRPSFVKGAKSSTDFNEYGCFIWEVGYTGKPTIEFPHIIWK
jgi:hypothetical protein